MSSSPAPFRGFAPYVGTWKRTLAQESFGPFTRQRDNAVFVSVEAVFDGGAAAGAAAAAADAAPVGLRWSFGANPEQLRLGYTLSLQPAPGSSASASANQAGGGGGPRGWRKLAVGAATGDGVVRDDGGSIALQLFSSGFASIVYRLLDDDTLAVTLTEVPTPAEGERGAAVAARDKAVSNVQCGFMFRVA